MLYLSSVNLFAQGVSIDDIEAPPNSDDEDGLKNAKQKRMEGLAIGRMRRQTKGSRYRTKNT